MRKITVIRPYEWYHQSYINIYIDDKEVGKMGSGKTMNFEVTHGTHKIAIKKNLVGFSKPIILDLNEDKVIKVFSFKYGWLIGPLFFLVLLGIYYVSIGLLGLERFFLGEVLAFAIVIALFLFFYSRFYFYKIEEVEDDTEFAKECVKATQDS